MARTSSPPDSLTRQRRWTWSATALLGVTLLSIGGRALLIGRGADPDGVGLEVLSQLPPATLLVLFLLFLKKPQGIRTSSFVAAWTLVLVVAPGTILAWPWIAESFHKQSFDGASWQAQEPGETTEWPPRLRMSADLLDSGQLIGLTRDEVLGLLGPPSMNAPLDAEPSLTIWYELGPMPSPASYGQAWLGLALSPEGQVTRAFRKDE